MTAGRHDHAPMGPFRPGSGIGHMPEGRVVLAPDAPRSGPARAVAVQPDHPGRPGRIRAGASQSRHGAVSVALTALLLASCTEIGPTVHVEAGAGKSQAAWDDDRGACTAETDRAVQPFANGLNVDFGRTADQVRADNGRIQQAYDDHYGQCMAAHGNRVAGLAPVPTPAPAADDAVGQVQEALALSHPMDAISTSAAGSVASQITEFRASCPEEVIAVDVRPALVSRTVTARLVALTLPHGGACFGNKGEVDYLLVMRRDGWETELSGLLALAPTRHRGFVDVEQQGAGSCTRTFSWNGRRYAASGARDC